MIGRHSQSPRQGDFARSPSSSRLDQLEGTTCCETTDLAEGNGERTASSMDKTGDRFVTVKRVFLQLWSDQLQHCGETTSGRDWESFKELSGQTPGECGIPLAFDFSFTTSSLRHRIFSLASDSRDLSGGPLGAWHTNSMPAGERPFTRS